MKQKLLSATIIAVLAAPSLPAFAQSGVTTLEEVIVTARKREETAQDTPIAVTVMLSEDLEKRGVSEFTQLSYNNPNVKINEGATGAAVATNVAIRGNLQNDTTTQLDAAVGTYIDGMIVSRTFGVTGSMIDMESVQTLKGPQGTLFGRNTTGGALLIATKNPSTDALNGFIKGEAGEIGTRAITGAINVPITDNLAVRLVGHHSERDGYMKMADGREFGDQEIDTIRAKVLWNITDATSVLLSAERVDMAATSTVNIVTQPNNARLDNVSAVAGTFPIALVPGLTIDTPLTATDEKNSADVETLNLNITHETEWGELKLLAGQRKADVGIEMTLPPGLGYTVQDKPGLKQKTVELQLNGSFLDDRLELTSGLYYFDEETHEDQNTRTYDEINTVLAFIPAQLTTALMNTDVKSKSLYAQATYALTDATNLTLGGRYTDDERESTGTYQQAATPYPSLAFEDDERQFNYLVSVDHSFTSDLMVYANTSTGYRSGGANLAPLDSDPTRWGSFDSESLTNYEIGVKSDWLDGRLRVNGAIFYQDYKDYQYTQIVLVGGSPVRQARTSNATIQGGELEVTALLPADIILALSYGYVDGEEDGGARLPNIPENTFGVALSKKFALAFGDIDLTANYDWRDDVYSQIGFERESGIEDRGILNLSAALTTEQWQAVAYVNNATDEEYYTHITYSPSNPLGLFGLNFSGVGLPRVAGVKLTYNF